MTKFSIPSVLSSLKTTLSGKSTVSLSHASNILSSFVGSPVIKTLWDTLGVSNWLCLSGIEKQQGIPSWSLIFCLLCAILQGGVSVLAQYEFASKDPLISRILKSCPQMSINSFYKIMSRAKSDWPRFNFLRFKALQKLDMFALSDGDVIALDDVLVPHPHAKKIPFLGWLFNSSRGIKEKSYNLVTIHAVKVNEQVDYPISFSIWEKPIPIDNTNDVYPTDKITLATELLRQVKKTLPGVKLWVAMDRWYLSRRLTYQIEKLSWFWVSKVRKNAVFYRKATDEDQKPGRGRKKQWIKVCAKELMDQAKDVMSRCGKSEWVYSFSGFLYWKTKDENGRTVYQQVNLITHHNSNPKTDTEEDRYKGMCILISNNLDVDPLTILENYGHRWRIECFYRNAKQELGLNECHSRSEQAVYAHTSLIFLAQTMIELVKSVYSEIYHDGILTDGAVLRDILRKQCILQQQDDKLKVITEANSDVLAVIHTLWPQDLELKFASPTVINRKVA